MRPTGERADMFKKVLILLAFILLTTQQVFAKTSIISGVEGTLKRTRGEKIRGFYNSVFSHKVFEGMDEYLRQANTDLYLVNEKYSMFDFNIEQLVDEKKLSPKEIISRELLEHDSEYAFKLAAIKKIIEETKDDYILIGNDSESDQDVFSQIRKEYPNRIKGIYIHVLDNKKLLPDALPFYTAFDIAVNEYSKKRLNYKSVKKIGSDIFSEDKFHKVFPENAHCPTEKRELATKELKEFDYLISEITKKTLNFCNG